MTYDKQRGRTVLFGEYSTESCGKGGTFPCAKTWELDGGRIEKPAQRMEVTFASSGEDLGSTAASWRSTSRSPEGNGCTSAFGSVATDYGQSQVNYRRCPEKELRSVVAASIATGTTTGAGNYYTPSCQSTSTAPERLFGWTAPATASYTFTTQGSALDTVLSVLDGDCSGPVLGCNDQNGGGGNWSRITGVALTAGRHVVIAVDGYMANSGNFVLNITSP